MFCLDRLLNYYTMHISTSSMISDINSRPETPEVEDSPRPSKRRSFVRQLTTGSFRASR